MRTRAGALNQGENLSIRCADTRGSGPDSRQV